MYFKVKISTTTVSIFIISCIVLSSKCMTPSEEVHASLKRFMDKQAQLCAIDPTTIEYKIDTDTNTFWKTNISVLPLGWAEDDRACITVHPAFVPGTLWNTTTKSNYKAPGEEYIIARHELGHIKQQSILKDLTISVVSYASLLHLGSKVLFRYFPRPLKGAWLLPTAATYALQKYVGNNPLYSRYNEIAADNFAIAHSTEKNYLLAMSKTFAIRHERRMQKLTEEAQSSTVKKFMLEIIKRAPCLIELCYWDDEHPSDYSRARKFYLAAQKLDQ